MKNQDIFEQLEPIVQVINEGSVVESDEKANHATNKTFTGEEAADELMLQLDLISDAICAVCKGLTMPAQSYLLDEQRCNHCLIANYLAKRLYQGGK